jgi:hypothetical protein
MFLFGYFLLQVYLSDREWAGTLLDRIFPTDPAKRDIYLAAYEGHLTRRPFGNLLTPAITRRGRITWISTTASRCILLLPSSTLQKSCLIPTPWKRSGVSDRRPDTWSLEALGAATKDRGRGDRRRQLGDAHDRAQLRRLCLGGRSWVRKSTEAMISHEWNCCSLPLGERQELQRRVTTPRLPRRLDVGVISAREQANLF